jgi:hypothetical protein
MHLPGWRSFRSIPEQEIVPGMLSLCAFRATSQVGQLLGYIEYIIKTHSNVTYSRRFFSENVTLSHGPLFVPSQMHQLSGVFKRQAVTPPLATMLAGTFQFQSMSCHVRKPDMRYQSPCYLGRPFPPQRSRSGGEESALDVS